VERDVGDIRDADWSYVSRGGGRRIEDVQDAGRVNDVVGAENPIHTL
jgi:hypothetical protein